MESTVQRENLSDLWDESWPLLQLHWREIAHYLDIPLDPDRQAFEAVEASGAVRCFTYRVDGTLAGYLVYFVKRSLNYRSSLQALQHVLFVHPQHRGRMAGLKLLRFAGEQLAAEGVQVEYQHQKIAHPALGMLLKAAGYEPVEIIWARRLDGGDGCGARSGPGGWRGQLAGGQGQGERDAADALERRGEQAG